MYIQRISIQGSSKSLKNSSMPDIPDLGIVMLEYLNVDRKKSTEIILSDTQERIARFYYSETYDKIKSGPSIEIFKSNRITEEQFKAICQEILAGSQEQLSSMGWSAPLNSTTFS